MRRYPEAGFTFIEMLIALALFALIAVGAYRIFFMGAQIWSKGNLAMKGTNRVRAFFNTVQEDVVNAVLLYRGTQDDTSWEAGKMSFTTLANTYRDGKPGIELAKVIYYFDEKKGVLIRRYASAREGFDNELSRETVFLEGLEDVAFGYSSGGKSEWSDHWSMEENSDALPRGIKVRVDFSAGENIPGEGLEKVIFVPMGKALEK